MVSTNVSRRVGGGSGGADRGSGRSPPPIVAFVAVFKLNSLTTFMNPARALGSCPQSWGDELLTTAQGLFSTVEGDDIAGRERGRWTADSDCKRGVGPDVVDAASFMFVALVHRIRPTCPAERHRPATLAATSSRLSPRSVAVDLREGWRDRAQDCRRCAELAAARLVPCSTRSTTVSPWTLTTLAPSRRASLATRSMSSLGT